MSKQSALGVVRWVDQERLDEGDSWRLWLLGELVNVAAREPSFRPAGEVTVRETDVREFPYGQRLRPRYPARLFVAEIPIQEG